MIFFFFRKETVNKTSHILLFVLLSNLLFSSKPSHPSCTHTHTHEQYTNSSVSLRAWRHLSNTSDKQDELVMSKPPLLNSRFIIEDVETKSCTIMSVFWDFKAARAEKWSRKRQCAFQANSFLLTCAVVQLKQLCSVVSGELCPINEEPVLLVHSASSFSFASNFYCMSL